MVAPGAIETDFSGGGLVRDNPDFNRCVSEMTALGRAGVSDDIGPMIASLVSRRVVGSMRSESRFRGDGSLTMMTLGLFPCAGRVGHES